MSNNQDSVPDEIRGRVRANRVVFRSHARRRMHERGATYADVREALLTATRWSESKEEPEKWRAYGVDLDGDELSVVVVLEDDVVIVTVM